MRELSALPDYFAASDAEEQAFFESLRLPRQEQHLPEGVFCHYDTPLTVAHEMDVLRAAGSFSRFPLSFQPKGHPKVSKGRSESPAPRARRRETLLSERKNFMSKRCFIKLQQGAAQSVDKVVTHFVEESRTSLVAYGSRPGSSVRKLFVPKSSKTAAHVTGF